MKVNTSKMVSGILVVGLALAVSVGDGYAQNNQPSAKATAKIGNINVVNELSVTTNGSASTVGTWTTVLQNSLKTANQKDLLIGVSMEVGLLTGTYVKSKLGIPDTSLASAGVEVRVLVDGVETMPGPVMFGRRTQNLTAVFQGLIDGCMTVDTNTWSVILDYNCVQPETLDLLLDTMNASAFNFVQPDLSAGTHIVQVQARVNLGAGAMTGTARARALIGNGSMTVESVRMIRNEDIELP